jgi:hypothetical protein
VVYIYIYIYIYIYVCKHYTALLLFHYDWFLDVVMHWEFLCTLHLYGYDVGCLLRSSCVKLLHYSITIMHGEQKVKSNIHVYVFDEWHHFDFTDIGTRYYLFCFAKECLVYKTLHVNNVFTLFLY